VSQADVEVLKYAEIEIIKLNVMSNRRGSKSQDASFDMSLWSMKWRKTYPTLTIVPAVTITAETILNKSNLFGATYLHRKRKDGMKVIARSPDA